MPQQVVDNTLQSNHQFGSILVIGELLADIISHNELEDLSQAEHFTIRQGGSPANLCANLKWMGVDARLISTVGADSVGDFLISAIAKAGVETALVTRTAALPTSLVLVGKSQATPDFIAYRMADRLIENIDNLAIEAASILHTSAFALSKDPARTTIMQAFQKAHNLGKQISVDWNFAPAIWGADDGWDLFVQLCAMEPLLKCSMDDVERFMGQTLSIEAAKLFLGTYPAKICCLTCGKDGVWYKPNGENWQFKAATPVQTIKSITGAGDAFWAGFLYAYHQKQSANICVENALQIAAKKIGMAGNLYD